VNRFIAESLVTKDRFYLYPSQLQALQQGILDSSRKHALIAMPTGSGKTLVAEFMILHALVSAVEKGLVIFVAPSRALVHEKFDELSESFKPLGMSVCQITGEVSMESEERLPEFDIAVVTPEKFDMLLRKRFYGSNVVLLIIDEFHNIRIGFRGVRMQFGLIRFVEQFREARILLMSAVISNPDAVSEWANASVSVRSLWRPTYVRYGKLSLEDDHNGHIDFSDGITRHVPFTMKLRGFRRRAAFLALQFSSDGPCMLFSHNRNNIFEYARMLSTLIEINQGPIKSDIDPSSSQNLARLKRLIGDKEELYHWFAKGIGVHWGELPHEIRRLVEDGLRNGEIRVVVSTTTLAEGVNLPLKTIIVPAALVASIPMDLSTFFNLAGRAGRPNKEVEGQLILMEPARSSHPPIEKYLEAKPANLDPIQTAILRIAEIEKTMKSLQHEGQLSLSDKILEREKENLPVIWAVLHSGLIAALAEKVISKVHDPGLAEKILIGTQTANHTDNYETVLDILARAEKTLRELDVMDGDELTGFGKNVVYPSGFSPESCRLIELRLNEMLRSVGGVLNIDQDKDALAELLALMTLPVEARTYFAQEPPESFERMIIDWMAGWEIVRLAEKYFEGRLSEAMTVIQGRLSPFAAWFLYTVFLVRSYNDPKARDLQLLRDLPKYAWFGSRDPDVLQVLNRDLSRELFRDDVLRVVRELGRHEMRELLTHPEEVTSSATKSKIVQAVRQTDGEEFVGAFQKIMLTGPTKAHR